MRYIQKPGSNPLILFALTMILGIAVWAFSGYRSAVTANSHTSQPKVKAQSGKTASIGIEVAPGAKNKTIDLSSQDNLAVAILSTSEFDAKTVDPATLRFAGATIVKNKGLNRGSLGTSDVKS